ncbi:MAG: MoaF N-terminal domain-containing protein [Solirubrobacterales bacterium]|nr:MoaF N-terminal domain-containing protein [Solirubrobacterales bacterium]
MKTLETILPSPPVRRDMDISANRLPSTTALDGSDFTLHLADGANFELSFAGGRVNWKLADEDVITEGDDEYDAVEVRPDLFFVDFRCSGRDRAVSVVLDRARGRSLVLVNDLVDQGGGRGLLAKASPARVNEAEDYEPIEATDELTGRRLYCEYSDGVALEHIYVNSRVLAWQWLKTPLPELTHEVGVESATYWKIADSLYLLHSMGDLAVELTLLLDLEQKRNVGRMFGQGMVDFVDERCGAKLTLLGRMDYPDGYQPA